MKSKLEIVKSFFDNCVGMEDTYLNLIQLKGDWYIANTDDMSLMDLDSFYDGLISCVSNGSNESIKEWFEEINSNENFEVEEQVKFKIDYRNDFGDSFTSCREFYVTLEDARRRVQSLISQPCLSSGYSAIAIMNEDNEDLDLYIYNSAEDTWEND